MKFNYVLSGMLAALFLIQTSLASAEYVFSAPPRETPEKGQEIYGPVAKYLSQKLGVPVTYRHPGNWLTYQFEMQRDKYDIVFDGPHFVSWRMAALGHEPVAKLPGQLVFYIVSRGDSSVKTLEELSGRMVCGLAPPNLATLTVLAQYPNISRQPLIRETRNFKQAYQMMRAGICHAAVLPNRWYKGLVTESSDDNRTVFKSQGVANQAFSAGKRVSQQHKALLTQVLMAPEGKQAFPGFHKRFVKGKDILKASVTEYTGHAVLLKDVWGFGLAQLTPAEIKLAASY